MYKTVSVLLFLFIPPGGGNHTPCSPDPCVNGFCVDAGSGGFTCSCLSGYTGSVCDGVADNTPGCEEGLTCFHGTCTPEDGENSSTCLCDPGFSGSSCSTLIPDYNPCSNVKCSDRGECFPGLPGSGEYECKCRGGYDGAHCENYMQECAFDYSLDLLATVYENDPAAGIECQFWIKNLWIANSMTEDEIGLFRFCRCLDWLVENEEAWINNMDCLMSRNLKQTVFDHWHQHCTSCTLEDMDELKNILVNTTVECDAFLSWRETEPQAWRTPMKCRCLESLGTREEAARIVHCPFNPHAARTDMICYDNCIDDSIEICDPWKILTEMNENLPKRAPTMMDDCTYTIRYFFEETPVGQDEATLTESLEFLEALCSCVDGLATYWVDGLDLLECLPVTFYDLTMRGLANNICYDFTIYEYIAGWAVTELLVVVSAEDHALATQCLGATILATEASAISTTGNGAARALELVCTCVAGANEMLGSTFQASAEALLAQAGISFEDCGIKTATADEGEKDCFTLFGSRAWVCEPTHWYSSKWLLGPLSVGTAILCVVNVWTCFSSWRRGNHPLKREWRREEDDEDSERARNMTPEERQPGLPEWEIRLFYFHIFMYYTRQFPMPIYAVWLASGGFSAHTISLVFIVCAATGQGPASLIGSWLSDMLQDRIYIMSSALSVSGLAYFFMPLFLDKVSFDGFLFLVAVSNFLDIGLGQAFIADWYMAHDMEAAQEQANLASSAGSALAAALSPMLADLIGVTKVFQLWGTLLFLSGLSMAYFHRNNKPGMIPPEAPSDAAGAGCWAKCSRIMEGPLSRLPHPAGKWRLMGWWLQLSLCLEWFFVFGLLYGLWGPGILLFVEHYNFTMYQIGLAPLLFLFFIAIVLILKSKFQASARRVGNLLGVGMLLVSIVPWAYPPGPILWRGVAIVCSVAMLLTAIFYNLGVNKAVLNILPIESWRATTVELAAVAGACGAIVLQVVFTDIYELAPSQLWTAIFVVYLIELVMFNINCCSLPQEFDEAVANALSVRFADDAEEERPDKSGGGFTAAAKSGTWSSVSQRLTFTHISQRSFYQ